MGFQSELDSIASVSQVRALLKRAGVHPLKSLGQTFLCNRSIVERLVSSAGINNNDIVLDVGAGIGSVTFHVSKMAKKVYSVEIDKKLANILATLIEEFGIENVEVLNTDILSLRLEELGVLNLGYKVVGSLPYYISKKIIRKFLCGKIKPSIMAVIVQKEVAKQYVSDVPKNSFLSESARVVAKVKYIQTVFKKAFYPIPPVDGAILRFEIFPKTLLNEGDLSKYIRFLRVGFSAPRKTLLNNLKSLRYKRDFLIKIFKKLKIDCHVRPQNVSTEQWINIWKEFEKYK